MPKKHTLETYLVGLFARHPDNKKRYNYDKSVYVSDITHVEIFCNDCGKIFSQTPNSHLRGRGCPNCAITARAKTHEQFIVKANKVHNNTYLYLSRYINNRIKIQMLHKSCGHKFLQTGRNHLRGRGCPKCGLEKALQAGLLGARIVNEKSKIVSDAETGFYINDKVWNQYKRGAKKRNLNFDIIPEDVLEIYKKQNGLCVFTGAKLICNCSNSKKNNWSIDRIDNSKGYTKDNIVLVTKTANMFRNRSTIKELLEFCNMVVSTSNAIEKYAVMSPEEKAQRLEKHSIRFAKKKD